MFKHIIDDNLDIRILELRHAEQLFDLVSCNQDYLAEWLPWVQGNTIDHTKGFIEAALQKLANNDGIDCGIFYHDRIVGCISLHRLDWLNKKTSIGYWLDGSLQGQGIMTKACKAMINYSFKDLQLNRIEIRAGVNNLKSRAIPERLGFEKEGMMRMAEWVNNRYINHVVYGLLKEDWDN
ncbi:GNAT family N-acetyltransferase [Chengkuizengella sediminis]|uniref:GNAT family N-acetyltransferase n=1 Tax=Chengkuizengella sediminis TaxID=1885917 RepID=UPI00138A58DB|nr:GNAT family protein [Chengkuizengella sediminis]NDI35210.1 GNAT family N-acetyltransferase [Chengkuizengella sediminis]